MKKLVVFLFLSIVPYITDAQELKSNADLSDSVIAGFTRQLTLYPQEKLYLHTDKPQYISGETLWFRAHLVDALLHIQANASRYVYTELVNRQDSVVARVKIRPDSLGYFHGHLFLDEELPGGDYMVRAYTLYMQNQGDDYFFKRNIRIVDPLSKKDDVQHRSHPDDDFDVSFMPEGGYLPVGLNAIVAFKAIKANGLSEDISGKILDEEGNIVVPEFKSAHLGMGKLIMQAKEGKTYYAECSNNKGLTKRFALPAAVANYCGLQVNRMQNKIYVAIRNTIDYNTTRPLYLLAHLRGAVLYCMPVDRSREYVVFDSSFFPSGIVQFVLFNENKDILSERLVFSYNENEMAEVEFSTDKENYTSKERIVASATITDVTGLPLNGNFSVSITDDKDILPDSCHSIISHLLLTSELKGHIEHPNDYLKQEDMEDFRKLDLVMLTHGWRRYDIARILKGDPEKPTHSPETSQVISGKASRIFSSLNEGFISILALVDTSTVIPHTVQTDKGGRFRLKDIEFPEETRFIVQANTKKKKGDFVFLDLDEQHPYPPVGSWQPVPGSGRVEISTEAIMKATNKYIMENGMRVVNLEEVSITAKRKPVSKSPYYSPLSSSQVITEEDISKQKYMDMRTLLYQMSGITLSGDQISVRGGGSPLIVLDGIPYEAGSYSIMDLDVMDISEIFLVKEASAGIMFGQRASAGALVVNTRSGVVKRRAKNENISEFIKPLGYQKPIGFYSPKYEAGEKNNRPDLRTTIFWKPDVTVPPSGEISFDFYAADAETTYSVLIEGTSAHGHLIYKLAKINILNTINR